eukprot:2876701-Prymnesium_polylepis.1
MSITACRFACLKGHASPFQFHIRHLSPYTKRPRQAPPHRSHPPSMPSCKSGRFTLPTQRRQRSSQAPNRLNQPGPAQDERCVAPMLSLHAAASNKVTRLRCPARHSVSYCLSPPALECCG